MTRLLTYLTLGLLPLYLVKIKLQNGSVSVLDLLLTTTIILQFALLVKIFPKKELISKIKSNAPAIITTFLFLSGFSISYASNVSSSNWIDGLGIIKSFLVLPILFSVGTLLLAEKNIIKKEFLLLVFFTSAVAQSFLGYCYALQGKLSYDDRLSIFYESPNQFSMILAPAILIGALFLSKNTFVSKKNTPIKKILIWIGIASLIFSLFLTQSLGAWLALSVSLFAYFSFSKKHLFKKFSLLLSFILILSFLLTTKADYFSQKLNPISSSPPNSIDSRIVIYKVSKKIINNNWLIGIGPGNFQQKYLELQPCFDPYPQWAVPHAHNNLLHIFVEGGILALFSFISLLSLLLLGQQETKKAHMGFFLVMIYLVVHGIFDTTIWRNDTSVLWWLSAIFSLQIKD